MIPYDLLIAVGSLVLGLSPIPGLLNKKSQFPRKSSVITAGVLTYFIPLFYFSGLTTTAATLCLQAGVWWGIFALRPIKKAPNESADKDDETLTDILNRRFV